MLKIKWFQCLEQTVYAFKARKDIIMYEVSGDPLLIYSQFVILQTYV
jgi:hypothetical protein